MSSGIWPTLAAEDRGFLPRFFGSPLLATGSSRISEIFSEAAVLRLFRGARLSTSIRTRVFGVESI